jgi:type VI secretion system protein ImpE
MTAMDLFKAGRLTEALAEQTRIVLEARKSAADRLFLCELNLYFGDLDAVRLHLDLLPTDRKGMPEFLEDYRRLLSAEEKRRQVFQGEKPMFFRDPPEHALARWEATNLLRQHRLKAALRALDTADALTPFVQGHIDGREFEGVRDGDDHLASILELIIGDDYIWVPFEEISRVRLTEREQVRDWLYTPAKLRLRNGSEWEGYLPALYPETHRCADDALRLGQETDWAEQLDGSIRGIGAHLLTFGEEELTMWEWTQWEA